MFTATGSSGDNYMLDSISVVNTAYPSLQLLNNPGFDNSTHPFNGWDQWCQTQYVTVLSSGCQSGNCINISWASASIIYMLTQMFSATIGNTYTISFYYAFTGGGQSYIDVDVI